MPTQTQITDEELMAKLKESHLEQRHKNELKRIIPYMSDEERSNLLELIKKSHEIKTLEDKAKAKYQEGLGALNAEFDKKINDLTKAFSKKARKEYEELEHEESEKELEKLESEISNL